MRFFVAAPVVLVLLLAGCSAPADPEPQTITTPAPTGGTDAADTVEPPAAPDDGDAAAVRSAGEDADGGPVAAQPPVEVVPKPFDPLVLPEQGPPVAPHDPGQLAEILTAAEQAIRDPARSPEQLEAAGHWQQVVYRRLGHDEAQVDAVLARVPAELHETVRANIFAGARLFAMHSPADPNAPVEVRDLPSWRIVAPPPADELKAHYQAAEAATGVHWSYLAAVNLVETRMGRIRGTSVAGAQGPMQFMPGTWGDWGEGDINDHRDAIMAAGRYLAWGGMPGDADGAIFRYNRDVRYVDAVRTYAEQIQADERAYYGYYHWQVYYFTGAENVWLESGYDGAA